MPMRRCRPCCTTILGRATSSAAISGTCVRQAAGWATRPPSRRKGRRPTRWKWACPIDRGRVGTTFDQMAQSIAGYEASAEVTPFTSKFDAVLAGKAQFTTQEQAGYDLFRGEAHCKDCHRD